MLAKMKVLDLFLRLEAVSSLHESVDRSPQYTVKTKFLVAQPSKMKKKRYLEWF